MSRFLCRKCVSEAAWPWLGCALAVFAYAWVRVWLVGQFEMERFQGVVMQIWDEFAKFSAVPLSELFTYRGRIARTFTEPIVVVCLAAWGVTRGSDVVSGELGRGTLEMVLSQPVGRRQLIWIHAGVTTLGAILLAAMTWLGIWLGVSTCGAKQLERPAIEVPLTTLRVPLPWAEARTVFEPMRDHVSATSQFAGCVNLACLAFALAGATTLLSSVDKYRWRTVGAATGLLLVESTLYYVALARAEDWGWLGWLTIFTAYNPELHISLAATAPAEVWTWIRRDDAGRFLGPGPLGANALLLAIGFAAYAAASEWFARRDIAPPP